MIVLYIFLCILGGLLLLLFLALLVPVEVSAGFREELTLELRCLFLRIPLLPGEPEEPGAPAPEPEDVPPEKKAKKDKPGILDRVKAARRREGLAGFLEALGELLKLVFGFTGGVLKGLRLKRFQLYLCVSGDQDAAAGAVLYGRIAAGVYPACGELFSLLPCKDKGVTIDLDYGAPAHKIDFSATLSIRPIVIVAQALKLLFKARKPLRRVL